MSANLENSTVPTGLEVSFHSNPKEGQCKECSNYHTISLISHALARLCSKSFKLSFNSAWTKNFQMYNLDLEKAEELEIKLPTSVGSAKARGFQENIYFCSIDYVKALTLWITTNYEKFLEIGIPDNLAWVLKILYANQEATARTGHETMEWVQNWERSVLRLYIVTLFTFFMLVKT